MRKRHGFSLLELLAVLAILGMLAAAAIGTFAGTAATEAGAKAQAVVLASQLRQARRMAIATGDNHRVHITETSYVIQRRWPDDSLTDVDSVHQVPSGVGIYPTDIEFTFEGAALSGGWVSVEGESVAFSVVVYAESGSVRIEET